jgi:hypothetical protein
LAMEIIKSYPVAEIEKVYVLKALTLQLLTYKIVKVKRFNSYHTILLEREENVK